MSDFEDVQLTSELTDEQEAAVRNWLTALRSGQYEQGQSCLLEDNRYCCLGVGCDIAGVQKQVDGFVFTDPDNGKLEHLNEMPPGFWFLDRFGVTLFSQEHLARMNDDGKTFAEIADAIELSLNSLKEERRRKEDADRWLREHSIRGNTGELT